MGRGPYYCLENCYDKCARCGSDLKGEQRAIAWFSKSVRFCARCYELYPDECARIFNEKYPEVEAQRKGYYEKVEQRKQRGWHGSEFFPMD
jgi:ribosome-binding protein aMBF1 (putative translation factor)